jgi:hypothetical protein
VVVKLPGGAEILGKALVGKRAKPFEQRSVALEIGASILGMARTLWR